jgi:hypothetical protein
MVKKKKKIPLFLIGALQDNTYLWIIPNSHRATYMPSKHKMRKPILIKMMKGDVLVCSALMLHAGYGYGKTSNVRFHMYLLCKEKHMSTLYDVDTTNAQSIEDSTKAGSEISVRFIEPQTATTYSVNSGKLKHAVDSEKITKKRKDIIDLMKGNLVKRRKKLIPGRKY